MNLPRIAITMGDAAGVGPEIVMKALAHRGLYARCRPFVIGDGVRSGPMEILLVTVANSEQYGNGAVIAPGARVDDGLLDLVAVRPLGLVSAAVFACRLFLGNLDRSSRVLRMRGQKRRQLGLLLDQAIRAQAGLGQALAQFHRGLVQRIDA